MARSSSFPNEPKSSKNFYCKTASVNNLFSITCLDAGGICWNPVFGKLQISVAPIIKRGKQERKIWRLS